MRITLRVDERERGPPRTTGYQPAVDAQMLAESLHIGDQVVSSVVPHAGRGVTRVRCAPSAAALIEQDSPVTFRVERPPHVRRAPLTWAAMNQHRRFTVPVPAGLPVHEVAVTHVEHPWS